MKICAKCGAAVNDNEKFCSSCGAKQAEAGVSPDYSYQADQENKAVGTSGMAVAGMVLGIVGIIISWFTLFIPSILGLIFSIIGMVQCKNGQKSGSGMAVAGLVLSIIALAVFVIILIISISMGAAILNSLNSFF